MSEYDTDEFTPARAALVDLIADFAKAEWEAIRHTRPYAFFLSSAPEGYYVQTVSATEEGLTALARRYLDEYSYRVSIRADKLEIARAALRWEGPEDGWDEGGSERGEELGRHLIAAIRSRVYEECDGTIQKLCEAAMRLLDERGTFGLPEGPGRPTLGFCYYELSDVALFDSIRALNPARTAVSVAAEIFKMRQVQEYFRRPEPADEGG